MAGQAEWVNTHNRWRWDCGTRGPFRPAWMLDGKQCVVLWACGHLGLPDSAKMAVFQCNLLKKTNTPFCCEDKDCICGLLEYVFGWKQKFVKKSFSNVWKLNCKNLFMHKHEAWGHHPPLINSRFSTLGPVRSRARPIASDWEAKIKLYLYLYLIQIVLYIFVFKKLARSSSYLPTPSGKWTPARLHGRWQGG